MPKTDARAPQQMIGAHDGHFLAALVFPFAEQIRFATNNLLALLTFANYFGHLMRASTVTLHEVARERRFPAEFSRERRCLTFHERCPRFSGSTIQQHRR